MTRMAGIVGAAVAAIGGSGWSLWLLGGGGGPETRAWGLIAFLGAALVLFMALDRKGRLLALCVGVYGAAVVVCGTTLWLEGVRPLLADAGGFVARLAGDAQFDRLVLTVGPVVGGGMMVFLWCEMLLTGARKLGKDRYRRRADSDLYGKAKLLDKQHMKRLTKESGLLLGQWGGEPNAPLVAWPLEGSAITVAPPRVGKGATIALNLLSPDERGFAGSTVVIDPRGELWCVAARRRRALGRRVRLIDPFGVVASHAAQWGKQLHLPDVRSWSYNPLDFIRDEERLAVGDINVLVEALVTRSPVSAPGGRESEHFFQSAKAMIGAYLSWVRFKEEPHLRNLGRVKEILAMSGDARKDVDDRARAEGSFCGGLMQQELSRQSKMGKDEAGSTFTTVLNYLGFLNHPPMVAATVESEFDIAEIADGNTDLFVVVPEEQAESVKSWIRLWIAMPNAIAGRVKLERDLLMIIDEMPRLGYLSAVMNAYNMAAGKGVHIWGFAQSLTALDETWGESSRKTLVHQAEVFQILGMPRTDNAGAEALSRAIGKATYETLTESRSGSIAGDRVMAANTQWQAGESRSLVGEWLVRPGELMTMDQNRQYVIGSSKEIPRDALYLHHARYWRRGDCWGEADANPFVLRKDAAQGQSAEAGLSRMLKGWVKRPVEAVQEG